MKRILLIAGHGAGDPGACATFGLQTYREADEAIAVVNGIAAALAAYACECVLYDHARNAYQDARTGQLAARCAFSSYDYLLEIHFNACRADSGDGRVKGTEIYYPSVGAPSGCETQILASLAPLGLTTRKAAPGGYAVINAASLRGCKANLLEVCFLDDADDLLVYTRRRTEICRAIADAVCAGLGIQKLESEVEEMTKTELRCLIREEIAAVAAEQRMKNPGAWSKADREWAEKTGLLRGTGNGMEYQSPVTREQLAAVLHRYAGIKKPSP